MLLFRFFLRHSSRIKQMPKVHELEFPSTTVIKYYKFEISNSLVLNIKMDNNFCYPSS